MKLLEKLKSLFVLGWRWTDRHPQTEVQQYDVRQVDVLPEGSVVKLVWEPRVDANLQEATVRGWSSRCGTILYHVEGEGNEPFWSYSMRHEDFKVISRPDTRLTLTIETPKSPA